MHKIAALARAFRGSLTGNYPVATDLSLSEANMIVVQSFGTEEENSETPYGKINAALAERALRLSEELGLPLFAQTEIADYLSGRAKNMTRIDGDPSSTSGGGLDSWGVIEASAKAYADQSGAKPEKIIVVTQAYLVARFGLQAARQGMKSLSPEGLPRDFAPDSKQWWTRGEQRWRIREFFGYAALKLFGKL